MKLLKTLLTISCAALFVTGCASPKRYSDVASSFPPIAPGQGRIFFYGGGYGGGMPVQLNGEIIGYQWDGAFFFIDRAAGSYTLSGRDRVNTIGILPGLSKYNVPFELADGETKYFKFSRNGPMFGERVMPVLVDKDSAIQSLSRYLYNPNATNRIFNHPPGE